MADERYEWLDRDAAERLLRGKPVETADERARIEAARLAAALDSAADPGHRCGDGDLPGEAAAMAAYRKARADGAAAAGTSLTTVRVTRGARAGHHARAGRGVGFARPLRFGIAAALAGCAIGGVAVATGSGMLPSFGDDGPTPGTSVSAAATPGAVAPTSPHGDGTGNPSKSPGATGAPSFVPPGQGSASPTPGDPGPTTSGGPSGDGSATPGIEDPTQDADVYRKSVEACRDYRSGRIDPERRRRLEVAAKGPEQVERFCDELLGPGTRGGGTGDDGEDGGKNSGGSGDDRDSGDLDDVPDVSLTPPVSWSADPEASTTSTESAYAL